MVHLQIIPYSAPPTSLQLNYSHPSHLQYSSRRSQRDQDLDERGFRFHDFRQNKWHEARSSLSAVNEGHRGTRSINMCPVIQSSGNKRVQETTLRGYNVVIAAKDEEYGKEH